MTHYIKVRETGQKTWRFLTRNGTNKLRIHAAAFTSAEGAQRVIDDNKTDNPGWEWKVVPA
jgi:hypothetical protein